MAMFGEGGFLFIMLLALRNGNAPSDHDEGSQQRETELLVQQHETTQNAERGNEIHVESGLSCPDFLHAVSILHVRAHGREKGEEDDAVPCVGRG